MSGQEGKHLSTHTIHPKKSRSATKFARPQVTQEFVYERCSCTDDEPCFQFGRHPSSFVLRSARLRVPSRTSLLTRTASAIWMSAPFEGHADVVVFCNLNATEYGQARLLLSAVSV